MAKSKSSVTRSAAANQVVAAIKSKTTLTALAEEADQLFIDAGGKSNMAAAQHTVKLALETLEAIGQVKLTRPTDVMVEKVRTTNK